jgi:MFS family permease
MVTAAMISSRRLARTGKPHWIPVVGMSVSSAALLMLALLPPTMPLVIVLGFFAGVGFGTVMPTSQMTMQCEAGRAKLGAVTAIAGLARSTGGAAGAALFGAVVFSTIADGGVVQAFHHGFLFAAALAALGAFTASRIPHITLWHSAAPKNAG